MGRFGALLSQILTNNFKDIKLVDSVEEADVVFPCVPIRAFEEVIKDISPKLKKGALVIDVCSVKVYPVRIMKKYLKDVEIIATHPLFGPDSAKEGLENLQIMMFNVSASGKAFNKFKKYCRGLKLNVLEMTPEEHDRYMAYSQAYTHFVGRIGQELKLKKTPIDTIGFQQTLKIQQYVVNDSEELFVDMHKFNPYSARMRKEFIDSAMKLDRKINLS